MVIAFKITVQANQAMDLINNIAFKLPKEVSEGGFDYAKLVQRNMRLELTNKNLKWRNKLWSGVQARKQTKTRSVVVMPMYGVFLDSMRPHFVKLKRGRLIRRWAMEKGTKRVKAIAKREGSIWVEAHPWIDAPIARSLVNLNSIIRKRADKALSESKTSS